MESKPNFSKVHGPWWTQIKVVLIQKSLLDNQNPAFVWVGLDCICWTISTNWDQCARTPTEGINNRNLKIWADVAAKCASAVLLGVGVDFWLCSEGDFLIWNP